MERNKRVRHLVESGRPEGPALTPQRRRTRTRLSATRRKHSFELANITSAEYKVSIESNDYLLSDGTCEQEIGRLEPGGMKVVTLKLKPREK